MLGGVDRLHVLDACASVAGVRKRQVGNYGAWRQYLERLEFVYLSRSVPDWRCVVGGIANRWQRPWEIRSASSC